MGYKVIDSLISERVCAYCGKPFAFSCLPGAYAYTLRIRGKKRWYCKYSCLRSAEREYERNKKFRRAHV